MITPTTAARIQNAPPNPPVPGAVGLRARWSVGGARLGPNSRRGRWAADLAAPACPSLGRTIRALRLAVPVSLALLCWPFLGGCRQHGGLTARQGADAFMELLAAGRIDAAYDSAAYTFQVRQSRATFVGRIRELGVSGLTGFSWGAEQVTAAGVTVTGELRTRTNVPYAVTVELVRDGGSWKVFDLVLTPSQTGDVGMVTVQFSAAKPGLGFSEVTERQLPPEAALRDLAGDSLRLFARGVGSKDFTEFYRGISDTWRSQVSVVRLGRAFAPFTASTVNLAWVQDRPVTLDEPPLVNPEGLLVLQGHNAGPGATVRFLLRYIYELPNWKLFGLEVTIQPVAPATAEPAPAAKGEDGGPTGTSEPAPATSTPPAP